MSKFRKIYKTISNILFYILLILLLVYTINLLMYRVINKDKLPRFFNYYVFNVASGSMEENIHMGDYIIVKKTNNVKVDDIVTYQKDNYFITHRIIRIDGDKVVTKGDANNLEDNEILKKDIVGKFLYKSKLIECLIKYRFPIIGFIVLTYLVSYIFEKESKVKEEENIEVLE